MGNRSSKLSNYDAADVIMTFGVVPITGLADGTFVSVERNEDSFFLTVGSDGEGCRGASNNRSGRVTFTLMQSSSTNDLFSAQVALDESSGDGISDLLIKDLHGTTLVIADKAWLVKPSNLSLAREPGETREWIIESNNVNMLVGGNVL